MGNYWKSYPELVGTQDGTKHFGKQSDSFFKAKCGSTLWPGCSTHGSQNTSTKRQVQMFITAVFTIGKNLK